jgi:hypothetical protein
VNPLAGIEIAEPILVQYESGGWYTEHF